MTAERQAIQIGLPYLEETAGFVRLCAPVFLHGRERVMWFSVASEYGEYLTDDRADAFVAGLFTTAMREGADIICRAPVTRRLLYQLNHYLIPMMAANMEEFYPIKIHAAPTDLKLLCAGAVGTGWSGGVDSMFTLMRSLNAEEPSRRLTHLVTANNGALESEDNTALLRTLIRKAQEGVAAETGLSVIGVDTNLQELQTEAFLAVAAFRHSAVALAMQKLFSVCLWSSAYEFARFAFDPNNAFYYELVIYSSFETDTTALYPAGGAYARWQKLQAISDYPLAHKYLHPCIHILGENCGRCGKCVRTEAALYGLGTLNRFAEVFDVEQFEQNKDWYFAQVLANQRSQHYGEALVLLRKRGVDLSRAEQLARSIRAAKTVVRRNQAWLSEKLIGE